MRAACRGDEAQGRLRHGEERIARGQSQVAESGDLDPGTEAVAVDGSQNRLRQREQHVPQIPRPTYVSGDGLRGRGAELGEVGSGAETAFARARDQHAAHLVIVAYRAKDLPEVVAHLYVESVDAFRAVERHESDAVPLLVGNG